jgi:alkanesulfonate monooxygenase SsuD/methylene tetrahydromethanopterin reductase-like flavin-dependent oxidoreductase (luciferase family)
MGARTSRIELGTAVIDMRYENPLYMAEDAASADLIAGGRLQLGISRGSPEPVLDGPEAFGYPDAPGDAGGELARARRALSPRDRRRGRGARRPCAHEDERDAADSATRGGSIRAHLVGRGRTRVGAMDGGAGSEHDELYAAAGRPGLPFDELQAEQIDAYHEAWGAAGWERRPRVSVSRSVIPITSDLDRRYFGRDDNLDQVGYLDGHTSRFGRTYTGEPDVIARELAQDQAVQAADTVLLTVPNQLGVEYNAHLLETVAREVAPALGWTAKGERRARA